MSASSDRPAPHIALLPSAGMGHLSPLCRLAATLSSSGVTLSFIAVEPTVSSAESLQLSSLFSSHPNIHPLPLHIPLASPSTPGDPFLNRFESIRRSAHLVPPLLASASPPVTALIVDISLASEFLPSTLPTYIYFISSAGMLALLASFANIPVPGLAPVPHSSIPPALHDPTHLFTTQFVANGKALPDAAGILINTFHELEPEALDALSEAPGIPKVISVGPLLDGQFGSQVPLPIWLDEQPEGSVVYVSFGNRTAMSKEQILQLGAGLERSGVRFLWVVKSTIVDRDEEMGVEELIGLGFMERVKGRGLVVNGWVEQGAVLAHAAVGGFLSHSGWNSVTEAAMNGVRMLAWPGGGDQRVAAEAVRGSGMGMWVEDWGWVFDGSVVEGDEIARRVRELMEDEGLKVGARRMKEAAAKAVAEGGSSDVGLREFIASLSNV